MFIKKTGILSHNALIFTLIGAVLVGAIGAVLAFAPPRFSSPADSAQAQPGKTALSGSSQQEAATATQQTAVAATATATASAPTATAVAPTATVPRPTPTATPPTTLRGTVKNVDTTHNQFAVQQGTGTQITVVTVVVTGQTTYQGLANSLGALKAGWRVRVTGSFQADGTWKALNVYTYIDN